MRLCHYPPITAALAGEGSSDVRRVASNVSMSGNVDKVADAVEVVETVGATISTRSDAALD